MINLRSELRRRLLGYFFTNPSASHYLRELAEILDVDPANLLRELTRLERQGLFASEKRGNQRYFRISRSYPFYEEVRSIVFRTVGVVGELRKALTKIAGIKKAYLHGSFARNQQDAASDIDVLVIGRPGGEELASAMRKLERRLRRDINYTVLSPEEFRARRAARDAFIEDVWRHRKIDLAAGS